MCRFWLVLVFSDLQILDLCCCTHALALLLAHIFILLHARFKKKLNYVGKANSKHWKGYLHKIVVSILTLLFAFYLRYSLLIKELFAKFQVVCFADTLNSKIRYKNFCDLFGIQFWPIIGNIIKIQKNK